jgi:hypothetical protein
LRATGLPSLVVSLAAGCNADARRKGVSGVVPEFVLSGARLFFLVLVLVVAVVGVVVLMKVVRRRR